MKTEKEVKEALSLVLISISSMEEHINAESQAQLEYATLALQVLAWVLNHEAGHSFQLLLGMLSQAVEESKDRNR